MEAGLTQRESLLEKNITDGNRQVAVQMLYDLIIDRAKLKDFNKAEAYRDRLYEVDAMALNQIIKVNEIIEEEKNGAFPEDHFKIWSALYNELSSEEANALFIAMREKSFDVDETVIAQGGENSRLYFVNQGTMKTLHKGLDKEILINRPGAGDVIGDDTFFSINKCTSSVITLTRAKCSYIERKTFKRLNARYPNLDANLKAFCASLKRTEDYLKEKGADRRSDHRFSCFAKIQIQVIKKETGTPISQIFFGELSDISRGGMGFYMKTKNEKSMRLLIGRHLNISFSINDKSAEKKFTLTGVVQGVQGHILDEYSVHMKFTEALKDKSIRLFRQIAEG